MSEETAKNTEIVEDNGIYTNEEVLEKRVKYLENELMLVVALAARISPWAAEINRAERSVSIPTPSGPVAWEYDAAHADLFEGMNGTTKALIIPADVNRARIADVVHTVDRLSANMHSGR